MSWLVEQLSTLIEANFWLGLVLAFVAGVLSFFTPCSVSSLPLTISYIGGTTTTRKKAVLYSTFIALGQTIVFIALGLIASLLNVVVGFGVWAIVINVALAYVLVIMAMELWGITSFFASACGASALVRRRGTVGAFLTGAVGAILGSACTTPIIIALFSFVAVSGYGIVQSIMVALCYSIGFGLLIVAAGASIGWIRQANTNEKFHKRTNRIKYALGGIIFILAVYLVYNALYIV